MAAIPGELSGLKREATRVYYGGAIDGRATPNAGIHEDALDV
jgi:hypothetical protein